MSKLRLILTLSAAMVVCVGGADAKGVGKSRGAPGVSSKAESRASVAESRSPEAESRSFRAEFRSLRSEFSDAEKAVKDEAPRISLRVQKDRMNLDLKVENFKDEKVKEDASARLGEKRAIPELSARLTLALRAPLFNRIEKEVEAITTLAPPKEKLAPTKEKEIDPKFKELSRLARFIDDAAAAFRARLTHVTVIDRELVVDAIDATTKEFAPRIVVVKKNIVMVLPSETKAITLDKINVKKTLLKLAKNEKTKLSELAKTKDAKVKTDRLAVRNLTQAAKIKVAASKKATQPKKSELKRNEDRVARAERIARLANNLVMVGFIDTNVGKVPVYRRVTTLDVIGQAQ